MASCPITSQKTKLLKQQLKVETINYVRYGLCPVNHIHLHCVEDGQQKPLYYVFGLVKVHPELWWPAAFVYSVYYIALVCDNTRPL